MIYNIHFLQFLFQVCHYASCTQEFSSLQNCKVFVCLKVSTRSSFSYFQRKPECKVDFGCPFELLLHMIQFHAEDTVLGGWHCEITNSLSAFSGPKINAAMLARSLLFFQFCLLKRISVSRLDFQGDCFCVFIHHESQINPPSKVYKYRCFLLTFLDVSWLRGKSRLLWTVLKN